MSSRSHRISSRDLADLAAQAAFEAEEAAQWAQWALRVRHAKEVNPDMTDEELGERFDCSSHAIRRALK